VKPQLLAVYLEDPDTASFTSQLAKLQRLTGDLADWLPPTSLESPVPDAADAVVVPDMTGRAYRTLEAFNAVAVPILVVTSEFGTVSMWDWEIRNFLLRRGWRRWHRPRCRNFRRPRGDTVMSRPGRIGTALGERDPNRT
jgi:hypothetical protein